MSNVQTTERQRLARPKFKDQYDNFIGGKWVAPAQGTYFTNSSPVDGNSFTKVARSTQEDVELAIDAAWEAAKTWNHTSALAVVYQRCWVGSEV